MHISDIIVTDDAAGTRVSARVDGRELYFAFSSREPIADAPSAFLACCIYPAMRLGVPLTLDAKYEASERLVSNLEIFQDVYTQWYPELERVPVEARVRAAPLSVSVRCGSMFSGGVDSFYTFLRKAPVIDTLVFAGGLDIAAGEQARFDESVRHSSAFAEARGKRLVTLWTNLKGFWPGLKSLIPQQGQVLAAFGIMLGFRATLIPASNSYRPAELEPWGSHPLTDPLFSTETTTTVHHGALPRREKVRAVSQDYDCLRMLRVCSHSDQYNCGACEKCLRTMIALDLLGRRSSTLPPLESLSPIRKLRLHSNRDVWMWQDNLTLAEEVGNAKAAAAIRSVIRGYRLRRTLRRMQSALALR